MSSSNFIWSFLISVVLHAGVLHVGFGNGHAELPVDPGSSAMALMLLPALAVQSEEEFDQRILEEWVPAQNALLRASKEATPQLRFIEQTSKSKKISLSLASEGDLRPKGVQSSASVNGYLQPRYPRYSRMRGEEGRVKLSVVVGADGKPGTIQVLESSGHQRLDQASIQAARQGTFIPAKLAGRSVPSRKELEFLFQLEEESMEQ